MGGIQSNFLIQSMFLLSQPQEQKHLTMNIHKRVKKHTLNKAFLISSYDLIQPSCFYINYLFLKYLNTPKMIFHNIIYYLIASINKIIIMRLYTICKLFIVENLLSPQLRLSNSNGCHICLNTKYTV